MAGEFFAGDLNFIGWTTIATLLMIAIGFFGWQFAIMAFGAGNGRPVGALANGRTVRGGMSGNRPSGFWLENLFLTIFSIGSVSQIVFWLYLLNFHSGEISFTG